MTREKIEGAKEVVIPYIMGELRHYNVDGNGEADAEEARKDLEEIFSLAIKALEQEYVIDKIRAEIKELYSYVEFDEDLKTSFNMVRLEEVRRVFDKYMAESEEV